MWWAAYKYGKARAAAHAANLELQALAEANQAALMSEAQGARWRRVPDGTWMRWSYLGNDWEKAEAPAVLLQAVQMKPTENYWTVSPQGGWMPYDPTKPVEPPKVEEHPSEQLPPPPQDPPRIDPDAVPRPEWTTDWKPGWNQEFK